jgi:hypothetical protein
MGRVPVFTTGQRQTAVCPTSKLRSLTTGKCDSAVSRSRLLGGANRPEADSQRYDDLPFGKTAKASLPLMYYHVEVR